MEKMIKTILTDKAGKEFALETNYELGEEMRQDAIEAREKMAARQKIEEDALTGE
jgi:hypothetical protein